MCVLKNDVVAQREWPLIIVCQTRKHSCEPVGKANPNYTLRNDRTMTTKTSKYDLLKCYKELMSKYREAQQERFYQNNYVRYTTTTGKSFDEIIDYIRPFMMTTVSYLSAP